MPTKFERSSHKSVEDSPGGANELVTDKDAEATDEDDGYVDIAFSFSRVWMSGLGWELRARHEAWE